MAKIGVHISIAGGIVLAPRRAHDSGCETFQCFTRSPQGGPAPELVQSTITNFKSEMADFGMETFYIHTPYYINFASPDRRIRHGSIKVVREELERGSMLGARFVMTHLGSYAGQTLEEGIAKVADAATQILDGYAGSTELLLEIAAGTGNIIGDTFEEVGEILRRLGLKNKGLTRPNFWTSAKGAFAEGASKNLGGFGGICFDTCHAFASGYDFRTTERARNVLKEFDKKIGLEYLKLSHINDSKVDLGGRRDRHEHIGDGFIGVDGLSSLLKTPEFQKIDWLLETDDVKREQDIKILKQIHEQFN